MKSKNLASLAETYRMPRSPYIVSNEHPYHVSARCHNKDWFDLPMEKVWQVMSEQLYFAHHAYQLRIHSFVLMNNHFHLLVRTPRANLSEAMSYFMRETSREIARQSGRINQTYGDRYHRTLICSNHYFMHAYKYIYRNPVEAGLTARVENYPHSTLHGLIRGSHCLIPIEEDTLLFAEGRGVSQTLQWLNHSPSLENKEALQKALRLREFRLGKQRRNKKRHVLETDIY
jgi:putative transposase